MYCPHKTCSGKHERGKAILSSKGTVLQHIVGNPPFYKQVIFVILAKTYGRFWLKFFPFPLDYFKKGNTKVMKEKAHLDVLHEHKD